MLAKVINLSLPKWLINFDPYFTNAIPHVVTIYRVSNGSCPNFDREYFP